MKIIQLAGPTTIGNRIVTPGEGPQIVTDETAADLATHSLLAAEADDSVDALLPPLPDLPAKRPRAQA